MICIYTFKGNRNGSGRIQLSPGWLSFPGFTNTLGELSHLRGAVKYHAVFILGSILNFCRDHMQHTTCSRYLLNCCCRTEPAQGHSSPLSPGTWNHCGREGAEKAERKGRKERKKWRGGSNLDKENRWTIKLEQGVNHHAPSQLSLANIYVQIILSRYYFMRKALQGKKNIYDFF